ncbi:10280_t:CDS:1, partial [Entrophospora sp. SA101]
SVANGPFDNSPKNISCTFKSSVLKGPNTSIVFNTPRSLAAKLCP